MLLLIVLFSYFRLLVCACCIIVLRSEIAFLMFLCYYVLTLLCYYGMVVLCYYVLIDTRHGTMQHSILLSISSSSRAWMAPRTSQKQHWDQLRHTMDTSVRCFVISPS